MMRIEGCTFVALDVETANRQRGSICQVGIAAFEDGVLVRDRSWLVNPRARFNSENTRIHGIGIDQVRAAPPWSEVYPELVEELADRLVVSYTLFDYHAMLQACVRAGISPDPLRWLDATSVVRSSWSDVARRGFGLRPMADRLGIEFNHHSAADDARVAGQVLVAAVQASGRTLDHWAGRHSMVLEPESFWSEEQFEPPDEPVNEAPSSAAPPAPVLPSIRQAPGCLIAWVVVVAFCVLVVARSCSQLT